MNMDRDGIRTIGYHGDRPWAGGRRVISRDFIRNNFVNMDALLRSWYTWVLIARLNWNLSANTSLGCWQESDSQMVNYTNWPSGEWCHTGWPSPTDHYVIALPNIVDSIVPELSIPFHWLHVYRETGNSEIYPYNNSSLLKSTFCLV